MRPGWLILALAATVGLGPGVSVEPVGIAAASRTDRTPPRSSTAIHEQWLEVDGVTIRALCTDGTRRVMLWHGDGASADTWVPVLERLDGSVGACAFDRRGSGGSDAAPGERGWYELLDELRRIHLALGFERDYVLVGHSLGGLYARVYASDRPNDLAALVLLEPAHEEMPERVRMGMPRDAWEAWTSARRRPNSDGVTEEVIGRRARHLRLPDIPVTVVTASLRRSGDGWDARFLNEAARLVHASILRGSSSGRHVPASRSGHDVQRDQPDLVAREILRLVRATGR